MSSAAYEMRWYLRCELVCKRPYALVIENLGASNERWSVEYAPEFRITDVRIEPWSCE